MTRKTLCASLVAAALAPVAANAAVEVIETYNLPTTTYYVEPVTTTYVTPTTRTYYYSEPASTTTYYYTTPAPSLSDVYYQSSSSIVVEAPPLSADQAITSDVVDRIASNPKISGRVGVETYDGNVELTGRVTNPRQSELAERDARSVDGVRSVNNDIRTRLSR
jgi:hypothetical protein